MMMATMRVMQTMLPQALLFLALFLSYVTLLLHLLKRSKNKKQGQGHGRPPPSPPGLPLIGHLHLVGFLPHVSLRRLSSKYSRDGFMLVRLGSVPTLIVSSQRAAEAVMRTHDHLLASRPPSTTAHALFNDTLDVAFSSYGDHWRQAKKLLATHLLSVKKVKSYHAGREEEVRLAIAKVSEAATARHALDMSELHYGFIIDLTCRALSGGFFKVDDRSRRFRELIDTTEALVGGFNPEDYFPWLLRVGVYKIAISARANKMRRRWDELLDRVINDHERKQVQEPDFIEVLLSYQHEYGLTRDHVKALLIDIFVAVTDTSYIVLEFATVELMRNPRVMSRLQDEVRHGVHNRQEIVTEDDLTSMVYLKAVIKETLRLHPPAPLLVPHCSVTQTLIDGYMVPAKTPILINAWALGRDASLWEDAEEFKLRDLWTRAVRPPSTSRGMTSSSYHLGLAEECAQGLTFPSPPLRSC